MTRPLRCPLWAALFALACERRLPNSDECVAFSEVWLGVRAAEVLALPSSSEGQEPGEEARAAQEDLRERFAAQVQTCLTVPYDRTFVECITQGGARTACLAGFRRRSELRRMGQDPTSTD